MKKVVLTTLATLLWFVLIDLTLLWVRYDTANSVFVGYTGEGRGKVAQYRRVDLNHLA